MVLVSTPIQNRGVATYTTTTYRAIWALITKVCFEKTADNDFWFTTELMTITTLFLIILFSYKSK